MKNNKWRIVLWIRLALLSALLASCSSTAPISSTPDDPTSAPPTSEPMETELLEMEPTEEIIMAEATVANNDPWQQVAALGRGVNFGNALDAPNEGDWGIVLEERFFDLVVAGGFDTIRLPVRWSAHAAAAAPYTIDPAFFARVDWAIANATSRGLNIIVNIHHYDEFMAQPEAQRERLNALWSQIATHYQDQPNNVLFELCNEPNGFPADLWNEIAADALAVVRESNPTRNVIIGGVQWNSVDGLMDLILPDEDRHIIATFHYYQPFEFTHQGAEWVGGSGAWMGTDWQGTATEAGNVRADFDRVQQWSEEHDRPVLLGEFGAYSTIDMNTRARWTAFIAREAESRQFAWTYWEFGAGFGVYDRDLNQWHEPLLRALVP